MSKGTCKAESCQKEVVGKGYCRSHYQQWKRGKLAKPRFKTCVAEGCKQPQVASARCVHLIPTAARRRIPARGSGTDPLSCSSPTLTAPMEHGLVAVCPRSAGQIERAQILPDRER
jgi:hypothetical protein